MEKEFGIDEKPIEGKSFLPTDDKNSFSFIPKENEIVWAKCKGFPWWPAKIIPEELIPQVLKSKKRPETSYPVIFYGSRDCMFASLNNLKSYEEFKVEFSKQPKKRLEKAIEEAENSPNAIDFKKETKTRTKRVTEKESKNISNEDIKELEERAQIKSNVKAKEGGDLEGKPEEGKIPEREKKEGKMLESKIKGRKPKKESVRSKKIIKIQNNESKKSSKDPYKSLLYLRAKLQKIFLGEKVKTEEFGKVDEIMKQLESFDVNFNIIKETKIGKVLKRITRLQLEENEPSNIIERANILMEEWKKLMPS